MDSSGNSDYVNKTIINEQTRIPQNNQTNVKPPKQKEIQQSNERSNRDFNKKNDNLEDILNKLYKNY
jgi:hypothetical protein